MVFQHHNLGIGIHTVLVWSLFLGLSVTRARIHNSFQYRFRTAEFLFHLFYFTFASLFSTGKLISFDSEDDEVRELYNHSFALPHYIQNNVRIALHMLLLI